VVGSRTS